MLKTLTLCFLLLSFPAFLQAQTKRSRAKQTRPTNPIVTFDSKRVKRGITFHTSLKVAVNYIWDYTFASTCSWPESPSFQMASMDIIDPEQHSVSSLVIEKGELMGGSCAGLLHRTEEAEITTGSAGTYSVHVKAFAEQSPPWSMGSWRTYTLVSVWIDGNSTPVVSDYPLSTSQLFENKEQSWTFTRE